MYFSKILNKTLIQKFSYLNQIQIDQFHLYMIFFSHISKINIRIKTKQNIKKYLYFVFKTDDVFKVDPKPNKSANTLSHLFKNKTTKQLYIRTNDNCFYLLVLSKKNIFSNYQNAYIVQGTRTFGYGNVFFLENNLIYSKEHVSVSFGIFINFPYKFLKKIYFLHNISLLVDVIFNPPLLTLVVKFDHMRFFVIKHCKIKKEMFFVQIGSFSLFKSNSIFSKILKIQNKIFIAISDGGYILTCKFVFSCDSKLKKIEMCGYVNSFKTSFLEWSNFFFNCLLSGEKGCKIIIWNEILIPILKIKIKNFLILNMKFSLKFLGFFLIVTRDSVKNKKKINRFNGHLLQNTIKLYTSWKKLHSNMFFTLNRIYCLRILKRVFFSLNFENEFDILKETYRNTTFYILLFDFLIKILDKIQKKKLDLKFILFIYRTIAYTVWFFFFFGHFYMNFMTKKQALYKIQSISQIRSFSMRELEMEQNFLCEKCLLKNYLRCKICKRISSFKSFHKNKKKICQFAHIVPTKIFDFFTNSNQSYFLNLKLNFNSNIKNLSRYNIKILYSHAIKVIFLQKEMI